MKDAQATKSEVFNHQPSRATRAVLILYFASLILLPWTWFPPFPWLHEHAQWSDAVFAAAVVFWLVERKQLGTWPRFGPEHVALAVYLGLATLSLLFASPDPRPGAPKLLGVAELCALAFITSDLASRPRIARGIGRAIAITSLVTAAATLAALVLFYAGKPSSLLAIYGELEPSPWYVRVQAGMYNPNLLANFCIFAAAVVARRDSELSVTLRRLTLAALWVTVFLTFSRGFLGFLLAAAIRSARTPKRRAAAALLAAVCVCVIGSMTLWRPSINPVRPLDAQFERVPTSRYQAVSSALATLASNPLFGSGLGTKPGNYRGVGFDSHCTYVNIAATLGLPALVVFIALAFLLWSNRRRPTDLALWGGFAGLAVDALALDVEDFRHVWILFGLAGAAQAKAGTGAAEADQFLK